jgi:hypothetical protein
MRWFLCGILLFGLFLWGFDAQRQRIFPKVWIEAEMPDEIIDAEALISEHNLPRKTRPLQAGDAPYLSTSFRWRPPDCELPPVVMPFTVATSKGGEAQIALYPAMSEVSHALPVVHVMADEGSLFGFWGGIYTTGVEWAKAIPHSAWWDEAANYHLRGKQARKKGYISFSEEGHAVYYPCKLAINGHATRAYSQKSIRIMSDKKRGLAYFNRPLLADTAEACTSFLLRNGGNDWDKAMMRDALTARVFAHSSLPVQRSKPVVVYINGTYWGIHNMRDRLTDDHFNALNNHTASDFYVLEFPLEEDALSELPESVSSYVSRTLKAAATDTFQFADFDRENWNRYLWAETFVHNADWPGGNVKMLLEVPASGHPIWKFILTDTDYGLGYFSPYAFREDPFKRVAGDDSPAGGMYRAMLRNKAYLQGFKEFVKEQLPEINSDFSVQTNNYAALLRPEIPTHGKRWRRFDEKEWEQNVKELMTFVAQRIQAYPTFIEQL